MPPSTSASSLAGNKRVRAAEPPAKKVRHAVAAAPAAAHSSDESADDEDDGVLVSAADMDVPDEAEAAAAAAAAGGADVDKDLDNIDWSSEEEEEGGGGGDKPKATKPKKPLTEASKAARRRINARCRRDRAIYRQERGEAKREAAPIGRTARRRIVQRAFRDANPPLYEGERSCAVSVRGKAEELLLERVVAEVVKIATDAGLRRLANTPQPSDEAARERQRMTTTVRARHVQEAFDCYCQYTPSIGDDLRVIFGDLTVRVWPEFEQASLKKREKREGVEKIEAMRQKVEAVEAVGGRTKLSEAALLDYSLRRLALARHDLARHERDMAKQKAAAAHAVEEIAQLEKGVPRVETQIATLENLTKRKLELQASEASVARQKAAKAIEAKRAEMKATVEPAKRAEMAKKELRPLVVQRRQQERLQQQLQQRLAKLPQKLAHMRESITRKGERIVKLRERAPKNRDNAKLLKREIAECREIIAREEREISRLDAGGVAAMSDDDDDA